MRLFSILGLFFSFVLLAEPAKPKEDPIGFYSADSLPVTLTFKTSFELPLKEFKDPITVNREGKVVLTKKNKTTFKRLHRLHTLHLYGVFTYHTEPVDYSVYNGAIKETPKMKILSQKKTKTHLVTEYSYEDGAVFYGEMLEGEPAMWVEFYMPKDPTTIYKKSLPKNAKIDPKTKKPIHPCTSLFDNSEFSFWYYWNPFEKGCPKSIMKLMNKVEALLTVIPMKEEAYPEYKRLYEKDKLRVELLMGKDASFTKATDLGRIFYNQNVSLFKGLKNDKGAPIMDHREVDRNHQHFLYDTDQFDADIHVRFVDPDKRSWYRFAGQTLEQTDIFIFSGHSFEGYYFKPKEVFKKHGFELPKDKYQVIFFDMCTSYSYYHTNFFNLKKKTKTDPGIESLEVLTNAIGAPFSFAKVKDGQPTGTTILTTSLLGMDPHGKPLKKLQSWQEILARLTKNAGYDFTALTNVLGIADNPTELDETKVPQPVGF